MYFQYCSPRATSTNPETLQAKDITVHEMRTRTTRKATAQELERMKKALRLESQRNRCFER
jgi:hypothetical protein